MELIMDVFHILGIDVLKDIVDVVLKILLVCAIGNFDLEHKNKHLLFSWCFLP